MKLREDKWLEEQAASWVQGGLITTAQADAILAKRKNEQNSNHFNATTFLAAMGGLCVVLGIALIISYNWENIPRFVKIGGFLFLLALIAEGSARIPEKYKFGRVAAWIGWLLMPLVGIGLWAQIYQLSGDPLKPILIALVLGLPLVWKTKAMPVAFLHTAGIVWALFTGAFSVGTWFTLLDNGWCGWGASGWVGRFLELYTVPILGLSALWWLAFRQAKNFLGEQSRFLLTAFFIWFVALLQFERTPFYGINESIVFLLLSSLLILYWGLQGRMRTEGKYWSKCGFTGLALLLYSFTFLWHDHYADRGVSGPEVVLSLIILAVGVLLALELKDEDLGSDRLGYWGFRVLLLVPVALSYMMIVGLPLKAVAVLANLALVALALWLIREGVRLNRPGRINGGTALMGLLVFTRFLDYFGSMLQSGFAFIVVGLVFVGLAYVLNRGRRTLLERAQGGRL
jgi:uncharacterized membrane protein